VKLLKECNVVSEQRLCRQVWAGGNLSCKMSASGSGVSFCVRKGQHRGRAYVDVPSEWLIPKAIDVPSEWLIPKAIDVPSEWLFSKANDVPSEWLIPKANDVPSEWLFSKANDVPSEWLIPKVNGVPFFPGNRPVCGIAVRMRQQPLNQDIVRLFVAFPQAFSLYSK